MSEKERLAGVLLHPTSLPGKWVVGDLGEAASRFVDKLHDAGVHLWQVLPRSIMALPALSRCRF